MTRFASDRPSLKAAQRVRVFDAAKGVCHLCSRKIQVGEPWHVEHVKARAFGGADRPENYAPAHVDCHKVKTRAETVARSKADRIRAKHLGAKSPSRHTLPCGRQSAFRKKINGTVERREPSC